MTPWPILNVSCVVAAREQIQADKLQPNQVLQMQALNDRIGSISQLLIQSFNCAEQWTCRRAYLSPQVLFFANVKLALFSSLSVSISFYISLWSSYLLQNHYHEIFHENVCPVPPYVHYLSFSISFDYCMQDKHLSETNSTQLHRCWPPPFTQ